MGVALTADELAVLTQARDICVAKQHNDISVSAAVSVLTSVLRRAGAADDDDPPVEHRSWP